MWRRSFLAWFLALTACGGSEFNAASTGGATASGGNAGADGGAAAGGSPGSGGGVGAGPITIAAVSATEVSTADIPSLTLTPTPSAGHAIIVGVSCLSTIEHCTITAEGVTDNQGNTYSRVLQGEAILSSAQGARGYIFIAENIGAPSGSFVISLDPVGSVPTDSQYVAWGAIEVAGLATPPSFDVFGITLVGGSDGTSTTAVTDLATTEVNELAIAVLTMRSEDTNMLITPDATWTSHHTHQNGASGVPGHSMVSTLLSGTDTISHTWTHDLPTRGVAAIIATFKGAEQD